MPKHGNLGQYISAQTIKTFSSPYNKKIELVTFSNQLRLDVNDLTQSGSVIEKIWHQAFAKLLPTDFSPQNILILGFGAGSALTPIRKLWPKTKVTGIEIDPLIIKIAKDYFDIQPGSKLELINDDALKFIDKSGKNFDLTLVDCYQGDKFPAKLENISFYKKLKKISQHILINRLFWGDYQQPALNFFDKLKKHFPATTTRTPSNFLIHI